ncbi:MAG: hypothetical protein Q8L81_12730 [Bacteroidota bacterium]|nr:hypothetical protein [Bacteroidota bacterium]
MKNLLSIIIMCVFIFSCKKKDSKEQEQVQPPVATSIDGIVISGLPSNLNGINGVFIAQKGMYYTPAGYASYYYGIVYLTHVSQSLQNIGLSLGNFVGQDNGGVLKLNNTTFKYYSIQNCYVDTSAAQNYSTGINWDLGGNTLFEPFNANITSGFPILNTSNFFPTSISKTQSVTVNFGTNNISNLDSLSVAISDGSGTIFYTQKMLPVTSNSVSFTVSDLSNIPLSTPNTRFLMSLNKYSYMFKGNKKYLFIMRTFLSSNVTVNP